MVERKLASVQFVSSVKPIVGADRIEKIRVMGWQTIASKGEFQPGDYCVFFEVDSVLPPLPEYEFMASRNYRVRTMKMRGELSQGLAMPISILKKFNSQQLTISEGVDVTELLEVKKWESAAVWYKTLQAKGNFPFYVPKTDETRIQSALGVLEELNGKAFYIAEKADGSSMSVIMKDDKFDVCSRNISLKESKDSPYWKIAKRYELLEKMSYLGNFAIQGELLGPGIQKNRLQLKDFDWYVFNIYDIDNASYLNLGEMQKIVADLDLPIVKIPCKGESFSYSLENLLEMAQGCYFGTNNQREGIVIRPQTEMYSETLKGRLSFKVLNNQYLLKEE